MIRTILAIALLVAASVAIAAGSGGGGQVPRTVEQTPEQVATGHYKSGLRYKNRAWKQEEKADKATTPEKRDKLLGKAAKNYEKAIKAQVAATQANPQHHEAANELGYALRRMGQYSQAIQWYDHALELQPEFLEAIEYRGEAYLAVGKIDAAKQAYMELFRNDLELAAQLLTAMEAWVTKQSAQAPESGESASEVGAFSQWVNERKELAELTGGVSLNKSREW